MFYLLSFYLGVLFICFKIRGDGNCLFRSIVFVVSGNEEFYLYIRNIIIFFIVKSRNLIVYNEILEDYFKRIKMRENGVWGIDIEIYFVVKVFNCLIFVYLKYGYLYEWLEFKLENKIISLVIYLYYKNFDYYDVVIFVSNLSELLLKDKEN